MQVSAQEVTPEPDVPVVVFEDGEYTLLEETDEMIVGAVAIAVITIIMMLVNGFMNGRNMEAVTKAVKYITEAQNPTFDYAVESRLAKLPEDKRRFALSVIDVLDPFTTFSWTDLDDALKAKGRDWLDGVVEPIPMRESINKDALSEASH